MEKNGIKAFTIYLFYYQENLKYNIYLKNLKI